MYFYNKVLVLGATDNHPERLAKLPKFLSVFCEVADKITILSSSCPNEYLERVEWVKVESKLQRRSRPSRIITSLVIQLRLTTNMLLYSSKYQKVITLRRYLIPAIIARGLGKKPIRYHAGPSYRVASLSFGNRFSEWLSNRAYSKIAVPSKNCIAQFDLEEFESKTAIGPFHLNDSFFDNSSSLYERKLHLGYFGNLTLESGGYRAVDSLVEAFRHVRKSNDNISLVLGGIGPLEESLKESRVKGLIYTGWLSHEEVRNWLDRVKLLVLPSIDEGLATIMLQAMARRTPVLTTPVAGNPDVIEDGVTGFLMENTTPSCIADNIQRALSHPDLEQIAENARTLVEDQYSLHAVVNKWRKIICEAQ